MKHLTEEQFVLFYYRDQCDVAAIEKHLSQCADCHAEFERTKALLSQIRAVEAPEPAADYESRLWFKLNGQLPEPKASIWAAMLRPQGWGLAAAMAALIVAAFLVGRHSRPAASPAELAANGANRDRIVLVAVGDHLERSQMLLVEIMNADDSKSIDFSTEQSQARDLLSANRLYRQSSLRSGDPEVPRVLDELERLLVEVANGPSEISEGDLQNIRERIQGQGLLFKVRVIGSKVRRPDSKISTARRTEGRL